MEANSTDATEEWSTNAPCGAIDTEDSSAMITKVETVQNAPTPFNMFPMDTTPMNSGVGTFEYQQVPYGAATNSIPDGFTTDATYGTAAYNFALPLANSLNYVEEVYELEDDVDSVGSAIEFYEDGRLRSPPAPVRKIKKHKPMTAEQQTERIQQLNDAIRLYDTGAQSSGSNIPPMLFQNPADSNGVFTTSGTRGDSVVSTSDSPPAKSGAKRGRPADGALPRKKSKAKKLEERKPDPATQTAIEILVELGAPFNDKLKTIVQYATTELRGRAEDAEAVVEELQKLTEGWESDHADTLKQLTDLLGRQGLMPVGGV